MVIIALHAAILFLQATIPVIPATSTVEPGAASLALPWWAILLCILFVVIIVSVMFSGLWAVSNIQWNIISCVVLEQVFFSSSF